MRDRQQYRTARVILQKTADKIHLTWDARGRQTLWVPMGAPDDAAEQFYAGWALGTGEAPHLPDELPQTASALERLRQTWESALDVRAETCTWRADRQVWGRCEYSTGRIYLHPVLRRMPLAIAEEVLVHELLHLRYPSHTVAFWLAMTEAMPDWPGREGYLRGAGRILREMDR